MFPFPTSQKPIDHIEKKLFSGEKKELIMQVKTAIMWVNNKIYQRHIRFMWLNIHRMQMYIFLNINITRRLHGQNLRGFTTTCKWLISLKKGPDLSSQKKGKKLKVTNRSWWTKIWQKISISIKMTQRGSGENRNTSWAVESWMHFSFILDHTDKFLYMCRFWGDAVNVHTYSHS